MPEATRRWLAVPAAAAVAALLAVGQPWLTHWLGAFWWRDSFCGSADAGDSWPSVHAWVAWWTATALAAGAVAGRLVGRAVGGDGPGRVAWRRWPDLAAAAGAAVGALTILPGLDAMATLPGCLPPAAAAGLRADVGWGLLVGLGIAAACAALPDVAAGLLAGWGWVWALNVVTGVAALAGDGRGHRALGTANVPGRWARYQLDLFLLAQLLGYLCLAAVVGVLHWRRYRDPRRAALAGLLVPAPVVLAYLTYAV